MLAIAIPSFVEPSAYRLSNVPKPEVADPSDVLIKIHAASINPIDVKKAAGAMKQVLEETFPYAIGYDCAGVVTEVGSEVKKFKTGDEVYVRLPESSRGSWSEYAKCHESFVALKPKQLSFEDAASLPLAAATALQAFRKYKGDLSGKTIFIPAGLSGTGSAACQLAKNVFKADKVITTVSTAKVAKVPELLGEGVVDQVIDYTKFDPASVIHRGSVDFIFDTTGDAMKWLSLLTPKTGTVISVATMPSGHHVQNSELIGPDTAPVSWPVWLLLNGMDSVRQLRAWRWGVNYEYLLLEPKGEDLEILCKYVETGKLRAVVGTRASFKDIEEVKKAALQVYSGRGGIGKAVLQIVES